MNANAAPLDLQDYLTILWRRKWLILAVTVVAVAGALFYSYRQTPEYTSSAEVVVYPVRFDPEGRAATGFINMHTETRVANSARVAALAGEKLEASGTTPGEVSAAQIPDSEALLFSATALEPETAQASAQAWADAYLELRQETALLDLEEVREPYDRRISSINGELRDIQATLDETQDPTQIAIMQSRYSALLAERTQLIQQRNLLAPPEGIHVGEVLRPASLAASPSNRNHATAGGLALLVGLSLGIGVAYLRDRLDQRIRGLGEIEVHSGGPVLAFLPSGNPIKDRVPITVAEPGSALAEAYTALSFRLLRTAADRDVKTLVVTSSLEQEGKSSIVANLGVVMAQSGKRVILVSADLRRSGLQAFFPEWDGIGLVGAIRGGRMPAEAMSRTSVPNLWVVHGGASLGAPSPLEILSSERMSDMLAEFRSFADFVLIDTPPLLGAFDAAALASLADGVLLVADGKRASSATVEQARRELELSGKSVIGAVVNRFDPRTFSYDHRYDYRSLELGAGNGQHHAAERSPEPPRAWPAGD